MEKEGYMWLKEFLNPQSGRDMLHVRPESNS